MEIISKPRIFLPSDIVLNHINEFIDHPVLPIDWFFCIILGPVLVDPDLDSAIVQNSNHSISRIATPIVSVDDLVPIDSTLQHVKALLPRKPPQHGKSVGNSLSHHNKGCEHGYAFRKIVAYVKIIHVYDVLQRGPPVLVNLDI